MLQVATDEQFFSFTVRAHFESHHRFDQCGIVMYLDSENRPKESIEYESEAFQHPGSMVAAAPANIFAENRINSLN